MFLSIQVQSGLLGRHGQHVQSHVVRALRREQERVGLACVSGTLVKHERAHASRVSGRKTESVGPFKVAEEPNRKTRGGRRKTRTQREGLY